MAYQWCSAMLLFQRPHGFSLIPPSSLCIFVWIFHLAIFFLAIDWNSFINHKSNLYSQHSEGHPQTFHFVVGVLVWAIQWGSPQFLCSFTGFLLIATLILGCPFLLAPSLFERTSSILPWVSISLTFGNPSPKFLLLYITRPSCRTSTQRLALAWGRHLWIQSGGS